MYSLTNPEIRENYLLYGNPDGWQTVSLDCALPRKAMVDGTWSHLLLIWYVTIFAVGLPGCIGVWWVRPQKTVDGIHPCTERKFFVAATHRKKLGF